MWYDICSLTPRWGRKIWNSYMGIQDECLLQPISYKRKRKKTHELYFTLPQTPQVIDPTDAPGTFLSKVCSYPTIICYMINKRLSTTQQSGLALSFRVQQRYWAVDGSDTSIMYTTYSIWSLRTYVLTPSRFYTVNGNRPQVYTDTTCMYNHWTDGALVR